eukprot:m.338835 g.338835  ORF g.338835 m.338835 type:complete len:416 (-) comp18562_c0_seq1:267-1514(-)
MVMHVPAFNALWRSKKPENKYMKRSSSLGQLRAYVAPEPRRKRSLILRATLICLLCVALFYVGWRYRIWETQRGWLDDLENEEDLVMDMTNNTRTRKSYVPGVTLVTHLTTNRLDSLRELLEEWDGNLTAAVAELGMEGVLATDAFLDSLPTDSLNRLVIARWRQPPFGPEGRTNSLYPANFLRNLAIDKVRTRSAFLIDVDFHPSKGLYRKLLKYDEDRARGVYGPKTAFVIPAFEIHASVVTDSKEQLIEAIQRKRAKPVLAEGMEPRSIVEYDPAHVYFIDYPKWYKTSEPYERRVEYVANEPYVMVDLSNRCVPAYDERFFYRGSDKQEYTHHLHVLGFKFLVLPDVFIVHRWHAPSNWLGGDTWIRQDRVYKLLMMVLRERGNWRKSGRGRRLIGHNKQKVEEYRNNWGC